ncbi:hypothetical protein [Sorangium sp. So ce406]|uniref:hypothetical protein n=1 Tax=Sorangium sp. So ce406 TaxID=3133311 RepID=UPI003F5C662F
MPPEERRGIAERRGHTRPEEGRRRALESLGVEASDLRDFLGRVRAARLPPGGTVEAKDVLLSLLPARGKSEVERAYRDLRQPRGERPTAGERRRGSIRTRSPPYVEAVVRQARWMGNRKAVAGPVVGWLRDRALPLFLRLGAAAQARAYAYRIDWEARAA